MVKKYYSHKQSAFALLYAVLLTGIILTIGLGLSSILTKQIVLSSIGSNSQVAYYAANTAKECVFFWGFNSGTATNPPGNPPNDPGASNTAFGGYVFDDQSNDYIFVRPDSPDNIICDGISIAVNLLTDQTDLKVFNVGPATGFDITVPSDGTGKNPKVACARVTVTMKKPVPGPGKTLPQSVVDATGYNLDCSQTSNNRRVERSIRRSGEFSRPF